MTEINSFLGLTGYYRRFISNFSKIAALITRLTQKNKKVVWSDQCEESFQKLKECLISTPMLLCLQAIKISSFTAMPQSGLRVCSHTTG